MIVSLRNVSDQLCLFAVYLRSKVNHSKYAFSLSLFVFPFPDKAMIYCHLFPPLIIHCHEKERNSVCVCEREKVCVCACVLERESVCMCVCARERKCVCVCMCKREKDTKVTFIFLFSSLVYSMML